MKTLTIDKTWDGAPVGPDEIAAVTLAVQGDWLYIEVLAPLHGDPAPDAPEGPVWGLWDHEVVELFVLGPDDRYTEIELGPHAHHLVLQLAGERNVVARELPLEFGTDRGDGRWRGLARIPLDLLPAQPWRGNAYAIHGVGEGRRYLVHAVLGTEVPDFHRIAAFPPLEVPVVTGD